MTPTIASLKTKVKNLTAGPLRVFFIPPYGQTLTAGETVTLPWPGGLDAILKSGRFSSQRRTGELIERMIEAKQIAIIPPAPQVLDTDSGLVRDLGADDGSITLLPSSTEVVSAPPTGLAHGTMTTTTAPLSWTLPTDTGTRPLTSLMLQYKANASPTWLDVPIADPTAVSHTITGLTTGTAYNFRIYAITIVGNSANSSQLNATTA